MKDPPLERRIQVGVSEHLCFSDNLKSSFGSAEREMVCMTIEHVLIGGCLMLQESLSEEAKPGDGAQDAAGCETVRPQVGVASRSVALLLIG